MKENQIESCQKKFTDKIVRMTKKVSSAELKVTSATER